MDIELTKRGMLMLFFRRRRMFVCIFAGVVFCVGAYLAIATPMYGASGSLLVKFSINATPNVSRSADDNTRNVGPEEDYTAALESNVELLQSRDLLRDVVNQFGVEKLYPGLTEQVEGEDTPIEAAVTRIIKKDMAVRVEQQSDIITLTYLNHDPGLAAQFLQRLMETFIERHSDYYKKPPTQFLSEQITESGDKLATAQKTLQDFKEKNGLSSLDDEMQELLQEKSDLRTEALRDINETRAKVEDLKFKEADLLNTYRPNSKVIADIRQNIQVGEQQLRDREDDLRTSANTMNSQHQAGTADAAPSSTHIVTSQIAAIDRRIAEIEAQRSAYNDLARQVEIDEQEYKSYVEHGEQARIDDSLNKDKLTSVSIIDNPVVPILPSHPKKISFILIGILGGIIIAGWSIILLEHFDDRLTNPEQVSEHLGIPVLASFTVPSRIGGV